MLRFNFLFDILQNSTDVLEADHICCFCFWLFQNSLFGRSPLFLFFFCDPNSISFFFVGASSLSGEHFCLKMLNLFSKRDDIFSTKNLIGCVASLSPKLVNYCWCKLNINFVFVLQWVRSNIVWLTFYYTHRKAENFLRKKCPNKKVQIKYHMTDFVQTYSHLLLKLHSSFSLQGPGAKKFQGFLWKCFFSWNL